MKLSSIIFLVLSSFPMMALAQSGTPGSTLLQNSETKLVDVHKTSLVPVLDGVLDDPIWREATVITDFHQVQPVDHGEPTEVSEFYIAYDERNFYMAARLYDSKSFVNPGQSAYSGPECQW